MWTFFPTVQVKSIYAEFIPSFWDDRKVKIFFKRFGEIESITLARNLPSSRRKDFAFVTYATRDAALACIEGFNHEQMDEDGSKVSGRCALWCAYHIGACFMTFALYMPLLGKCKSISCKSP